MPEKAWYLKGKDGINRGKEEAQRAKERRENQGPLRFWLNYDSSANVILLDTPWFFFYEHNLSIGGKYHNYYTCVRDIEPCPLDKADRDPSYSLAFTGIDCTKFTTKDGVTKQYQKRLFVLRGKALEVMTRRMEKLGELKGMIFEFARGSKKTECSTGEDITFSGKKVTAEQLRKMFAVAKPEGTKLEDWVKPIDYVTILKPKSVEELRALVGATPPVGASDEFSGASDGLDSLLSGDDAPTEKKKTPAKEEKPAKADKPKEKAKPAKKKKETSPEENFREELSEMSPKQIGQYLKDNDLIAKSGVKKGDSMPVIIDKIVKAVYTKPEEDDSDDLDSMFEDDDSTSTDSEEDASSDDDSGEEDAENDDADIDSLFD